MTLYSSFFTRDTKTVARELLGCTISKDGLKARIVETEAYLEEDPASHAYGGRTQRNMLMYETYCHVYVYICYGIHNMLNFTTEKDNAGAVLIRAVEPLEGIEEMRELRGVEDRTSLCNGPGKVCEALDIDKELNGNEIGDEISLEKGEVDRVRKSTRIGISKAKDRKLRFFIPGNDYVSQR